MWLVLTCLLLTRLSAFIEAEPSQFLAHIIVSIDWQGHNHPSAESGAAPSQRAPL
jgi:hypothetical protein